MIGAAAALLALVVFAGGALATGAALTARVDDGLLGVERFTTSFLFGAGVIGLALFLVGLAELNRLTIGLPLAASYTPLMSGRVRSRLREDLCSMSSGFSASMTGHLAVLAVLFLVTMTRPTGDIGNDTISYHLLGPVVWLRTGRIVPVLDSSPTAFPALIESLFSAGMAFSNDRFPAMLGIVFAAVLLGQVYGLSRALGSSKGQAILMSFLVACAPAVMSSAPSGFVDIGYATFSLAAVRSLLLGQLSGARAAVGGALLGFALCIKYTAIPLFAITLVGLFLAHSRRLRPRTLLGRAAAVTVVAIVVGAPFYLKNALLLGSPIYPPPLILAQWVHARGFPIEASAAFERYIAERGRGLGRGPLDLFLLPWRYSLFTERFHGAGGIGAAPLALGVIGALATSVQRRALVLLLWMGLVTLVWFLSQQESRFLIHVVAISFAFASVGAMWIERQWPRTGRASVILVAGISIGYGLAVMVRQHGERLVAAFSTGAEQRLRIRDVPYLQAWEYLNRAPGVRCVLILNEFVPTYYLGNVYVKIKGLYGERPVPGIESSSEALAHLGELGVSHVLDVNPPGTPPGSGFQVGSEPGLRLVFLSEDARVYEVLPGPSGGERSTLYGHTAFSRCATSY